MIHVRLRRTPTLVVSSNGRRFSETFQQGRDRTARLLNVRSQTGSVLVLPRLQISALEKWLVWVVDQYAPIHAPTVLCS